MRSTLECPETGHDSPRIDENWSLRRRIGLLAGPLLFFGMLSLPGPADMPDSAWSMAAIALLMVVWWITEAIPIPATSLLPLVLMPLAGVMPIQDAAAPFANELIFLFLGGFLIALGMQRWNLHRRIALTIVYLVGISPERLIFGFMLASACISAFVSNTVTAIMMMPIGLSVISQVVQEGRREGLDKVIDFSPERFSFGINLMLGIAYACSIGGMATLIGTPPNTVLASYVLQHYGLEISFARWMLVGVPLSSVMLVLCWLWLTRVAHPMKLLRVPGGRRLIETELRSLGDWSRGELFAGIVFAVTALAWISRPFLVSLLPASTSLSDAGIGLMGGLLLFLLPVNWRQGKFVLNWDWAQRIPWGVLILFGGGLSLAAGFDKTGLSAWLAGRVQLLGDAPLLVLVLAVTALILFLTELTSNTATAAISMPLLAAVADGIGHNPMLLLVPAALAASSAFMLPVATPPNAIVFGSGYVTIPQMARSGFVVNLIGLALIPLVTWLLVIHLF
ncbi:MAG: DASS family sodium-coupled anion symporter [Geobacteraceae bacterium]|nr:DASS family sodium-coupled anion symporter [Geobacteraceae bacterium]